ncbi:hypothetical protein QMA61_18205 [Streptomyces coelicoflavus]|uniref:hypothetical protein n=1 Tax=Streptomyces coelicoflavus TaxID=285562 RepID=UPI0024ADBB1E|nr:hypothetical protein [Streptomyces coelicoflavus]MDI6518128.1 hypothetical protein [Streptomyces coelicoflavus]
MKHTDTRPQWRTIRTRGRTEYAVTRCPRCKAAHRHVQPGEVTAPCGAVYRVGPVRIPWSDHGLALWSLEALARRFEQAAEEGTKAA